MFLLGRCKCQQSSCCPFLLPLLPLLFLSWHPCAWPCTVKQDRNTLGLAKLAKREIFLTISVPPSHMFIAERKRRLSGEGRLEQVCIYVGNNSGLHYYSTLGAVISDLRGGKAMWDHPAHLKAWYPALYTYADWEMAVVLKNIQFPIDFQNQWELSDVESSLSMLKLLSFITSLSKI